MGLSKTGPRRLTAAERRHESVRLRREGETLDRIAAKLGCSRQAIIKHLRTALANLAENTQAETAEWRTMELERLDALQHAIWDKAVAGDHKAVDQVLWIMERRARMLALDGRGNIGTAIADGSESTRGVPLVLPPTAPGVEEWVQQCQATQMTGQDVDGRRGPRR